jgi:hypothetical protein
MTTFGRWLPAITQTPIIRNSALGLAGLAFAAGAVAGPATAATATAAAPADKPTPAAAQKANKTPSAKTVDVQYEAQPNFYYCGPAATRIALTGLGHDPSQDDVAKQLGTTTDGTNSAEDTTRVLNAITGGDVYKTKSIPDKKASRAEAHRLQADVVRAIDNNHPVVANIAGTTTDTDGNVHSFEGGHYLTIVGYNDGGRTVNIADPANVNGQNHYTMTTTDMANWIATRGYSA